MEPIRVLLLDDNPTFRQIAVRFLQQHDDITIVGAAAGSKQDLLQAPACHPQVVVIALGTPGLTGLEAIACLHEMMPEVGIIATSLLADDGYRQVALAAGAAAFVPKASLSVHLVPAIRQVAQAT